MIGKVEKYLLSELDKKGALLFTLIDPDDHTGESAVLTAKNANEAGSDLILIGGSTLSSQEKLDSITKNIKENVNIPIVLFPGNVSWLTKYADATYFMSLLNSRNPYWISGAQAKGAPVVHKIGIEPISVAYLVVEPGGTVGKVGEVELIKRNELQRAASLALAAQFMGFHFVITDTGSNPKEGHVPLEMIRAVAHAVDIPYVVAGGIKTPEQARDVIKAGAGAIQVGTAFEKGKGSIDKIKEMVKAVREGAKERLNHQLCYVSYSYKFNLPNAHMEEQKADDKPLLSVRSNAALLGSEQILQKHYPSLVLRYAPINGKIKIALTSDILAHAIMVVCAAVPKYAGLFDYVAAVNPNYNPDYAIRTAEEMLKDPESFHTTEKELREMVDAIIPQEASLIMIWDVSMQNTAKSKGEFKKRLNLALESKDLERLPKEIANFNKSHIRELLDSYRMGKFCPNCGWDLPCLAGIAISPYGDEEDLRYFQCENDSKFFVSRLYEKFMTDETSELFYEIFAEKAKEDLEAIKKCPDPSSKHCNCEVHEKHRFG